MTMWTGNTKPVAAHIRVTELAGLSGNPNDLWVPGLFA